MFQAGRTVFHDEYGWGKFQSVIGDSLKLARIEFPGRGVRFVALPSRRLKTARQKMAELQPRNSPTHPSH